MTAITKYIDKAQACMLSYLKAQDAFWKWDGHKHLALLVSGKISDFFANLSLLYTNIRLQDQIGVSLAYKAHLTNDVGIIQGNSWAVGSAMGSIGLAQSLARCLDTRCAFTEKVDEGMCLKRFDLGERPIVILCEDVTTTGGTTKKTRAALLDNHPDVEFYPFVLSIIDRSKGNPFREEGLEVVSLCKVEADVWDSPSSLPEHLEKCTAIRPKGNWEKLTTEML